MVKACQLAMAYRDIFRKDIIVDYVCYRKWGHNELDEPSFTQPRMYTTIRSRPNIPDAYADRLVVSFRSLGYGEEFRGVTGALL